MARGGGRSGKSGPAEATATAAAGTAEGDGANAATASTATGTGAGTTSASAATTNTQAGTTSPQGGEACAGAEAEATSPRSGEACAGTTLAPETNARAEARAAESGEMKDAKSAESGELKDDKTATGVTTPTKRFRPHRHAADNSPYNIAPEARKNNNTTTPEEQRDGQPDEGTGKQAPPPKSTVATSAAVEHNDDKRKKRKKNKKARKKDKTTPSNEHGDGTREESQGEAKSPPEKRPRTAVETADTANAAPGVSAGDGAGETRPPDAKSFKSPKLASNRRKRKERENSPAQVPTVITPKKTPIKLAQNCLRDHCLSMTGRIHPTMTPFLLPNTILKREGDTKSIQLNIPNVNHNTVNSKKVYEIGDNILGNPLRATNTHAETFGQDMELFVIWWDKVRTLCILAVMGPGKFFQSEKIFPILLFCEK